MRDLEKAKKLIKLKLMSLKKISEISGIPYPTVRGYSSNLDKLEEAKSKQVNKLAEVYDEFMKEEEEINKIEKDKAVKAYKITMGQKDKIPTDVKRKYVDRLVRIDIPKVIRATNDDNLLKALDEWMVDYLEMCLFAEISPVSDITLETDLKKKKAIAMAITSGLTGK